MPDISVLSGEAIKLHDLFVSFFYSLAAVLLLLGVAVEYFKLPLGGVPSFSQLIGRALIAAILLVCYPEISNTIAQVFDAVAEKVGSLNNYRVILHSTGQVLKHYKWSLISIPDTLLAVVAYLGFYVLYLTVFFFDSAILYSWVLLYVFSPLLIALFILPQTASATTALFRSLFEVSSWKIVWSTLGTLLWSLAANQLQAPDKLNFITLTSLLIILALSLIFTPIVVHGLTSKGISGVASKFAAVSGAALAAPILGTAGLTAIATAPNKTMGKLTHMAMKGGLNKLKNTFSSDSKKLKTGSGSPSTPAPPDWVNDAPFPTEPPGYLHKRLEREKNPQRPQASAAAANITPKDSSSPQNSQRVVSRPAPQKPAPIKSENQSIPRPQRQTPVPVASASEKRPVTGAQPPINKAQINEGFKKPLNKPPTTDNTKK